MGRPGHHRSCHLVDAVHLRLLERQAVAYETVPKLDQACAQTLDKLSLSVVSELNILCFRPNLACGGKESCDERHRVLSAASLGSLWTQRPRCALPTTRMEQRTPHFSSSGTSLLSRRCDQHVLCASILE